MVRDEIKNLTQSEVLKNVNNLTDEELKYHGIKRIPFDEIPAVYVDDIEEYAKANGYLNQEEYNERINNAMAGVKDIEHLEQPESLQEILKSLAAKRRKLHEDFRKLETDEDMENLQRDWEEYDQQVEALKEIPNIDATLQVDEIELNIKLAKCQNYNDFRELSEWWSDRHPHIIPHYDISLEELERRFGFVSYEDIWKKHFGDTPIPGIDYEVTGQEISDECIEQELCNESDREQEEFIEQCRRELEARVKELRIKRLQ